MKYSGIVLISDLDNTLLGEDRKLSPENLNAIRSFTENGGLFGIATGRMEHTAGKTFPELPINIPSIFYNGALIYDTVNNEKIMERVVPVGLDGFFQGFLDKFPDLGLEINSKGKAYILRGNRILDVQLAREGMKGIDAGWNEIPRGWYKVLFASSHESLLQVKELLDGLERTDINAVFSESELLDVMEKDASKGNALNYLKERFNWKRVVAVGDSDNDLSLIKSADLGFAVANATEAVKKAANQVIGPNRIPCIPQVLKIIDEVFC